VQVQQPVIKIQLEDFSLEREAKLLREQSSNTGALVTFSGLVRDLHEGEEVTGLYLEHYPGMTEKSLAAIAQQAQSRWPLQGVTIIHRIGQLQAGEQIVFVGVSSAHRHAAFAACDFIMDYLKTEADIAGYLTAVLEDGDPALFVAAIGDIARAKGMTAIAKKSGVTRESLYRALKIEARPRFETVTRVIHALGMKLSVHA
jgi:molybdopterin synthase catalytic subunit